MVNYKDETRGKKLLMEGQKCLDGYCNLDEVLFQEIEATARMWSDPASWNNGVVPLEGDDVVIEAGWNMYLDISETPILDSLEINGRLTFL